MPAPRSKIALVCDWYAPQIGGIEAQIHGLARGLAARGYAPVVITTTPGPTTVEGVPVRRLGLARLARWNLAIDPRATATVARVLTDERAALVHAHSLQSPLAHAAVRAARALGLPCVWTQHSLLSGAGAAAVGLGAALSGAGAAANAITAVSTAAAAATRALLGRPVDVVHNGVALAAWARPPARGAGSPTVITVSRLFAHKRVDLLVRALALVAARTGAAAPRTWIVGDGPARPALEALAARLGVAASTRFVGALRPAQVAALLGQSDVFVLPNPREAFGLAALEARAAGLPVIARRESGARDLIVDGRHGVLCGSDGEVAAAIARLCAEPATRAALAAHAGQDLAHYDWDHAVARYLAVYARCLGGVVASSRGLARAAA